MEPAYSGYAFPGFDNFTVTDRYPSASPMKSSVLGDEQLRATFTDNGKEGEGLFAASVVDFGSLAISNGNVVGYQLQTVDGGYYMAYNIVAVTAAKDTFIEWEGVLTDCFKTCSIPTALSVPPIRQAMKRLPLLSRSARTSMRPWTALCPSGKAAIEVRTL